ncbi:ATP-binding protein [Undibacterium cyanobacteriorum]|uniref:histidine kinase n=1 Tax=Undibacterium cyanobacteriorum TaxID=3073561 RepID=A0ABY9RKY3_9BURK|nr:ATP-binding protein [Undibacterium sp. 20NA77.5]WMW81508.1 ATP-binding protein [Undibacterium sp. 20NA77.5]
MQESHLRSKIQQYRRHALMLGLCLCLLWSFSIYRFENAAFEKRAATVIELEQKRANALAQSVVADLQRSLRNMQGIPYVLANQALVLEGVRSAVQVSIDQEPPEKRKLRIRQQNAKDPWRQINQALYNARNHLSFDFAYVLDRNGDCLAASDFQSAESLIGNNYSERHYFKAALNGESGYQFALGKTSRTPGLYFSAPVFDGERIVAVMVAKIDIARLAQHIDLSGIFLIDENGVVILAQDGQQVMKANQASRVFDLPPEKRKSLYGRDEFSLLDVKAWHDPRFPSLKQIGNQQTPSVLGRFQLSEKPLEVMSALSLSEIDVLESEKDRTLMISTVAGCCVIIIVAFILLYFLESNVTKQVLQTQRRKLSEAQNLASMGSWSLDPERGLFSFSDAARRLLSIHCVDGDLTTSNFLERVHSLDRESVEQALRRAIEQQHDLHIGFRLVEPLGDVRFFVADARNSIEPATGEHSLEGTVRDVTEYQTLLNALESSEAHLRKVINACLIGIVQGRQDGRLYGANEAFLKLSGFSAELVEQQLLSWADLTPEIYRERDQEALASLQLDHVASSYEKELICADGRVIPVLVGIAMVDVQERDWVAFVLDLSERNRVQRLQSEFIAIVSHELRTPLTSIRGSLSLLENGVMGALPEKALQMISVAHRNSKRLSNLVNDILDMEKLSTGKMKLSMRVLDLVNLLPQVLEANAAYAQSCYISFELELEKDGAFIWGDEERLHQVLGNLLSNAVKFSEPHQKVVLRLMGDEAHWHIHVIDHGPGIPSDFQAVMFDSFAQADNSDTRQKQGSGLGLKITKSMVELMEGKIGFTSSVQAGTDFWISFERIDPSAQFENLSAEAESIS